MTRNPSVYYPWSVRKLLQIFTSLKWNNHHTNPLLSRLQQCWQSTCARQSWWVLVVAIGLFLLEPGSPGLASRFDCFPISILKRVSSDAALLARSRGGNSLKTRRGHVVSIILVSHSTVKRCYVVFTVFDPCNQLESALWETAKQHMLKQCSKPMLQASGESKGGVHWAAAREWIEEHDFIPIARWARQSRRWRRPAGSA